MSLGEARKRQIKIGANEEKKGEFWENRKWKIYGRKNRRCQVRERERVVHTSGFILWAVIFLLDFLSLSLSFFLFLSPLGLQILSYKMTFQKPPIGKAFVYLASRPNHILTRFRHVLIGVCPPGVILSFSTLFKIHLYQISI